MDVSGTWTPQKHLASGLDLNVLQICTVAPRKHRVSTIGSQKRYTTSINRNDQFRQFYLVNLVGLSTQFICTGQFNGAVANCHPNLSFLHIVSLHVPDTVLDNNCD